MGTRLPLLRWAILGELSETVWTPSWVIADATGHSLAAVGTTLGRLERDLLVFAKPGAARRRAGEAPCLGYKRTEDGTALLDLIDTIRGTDGAGLDHIIDDTGRDASEILRILSREAGIVGDEVRGWTLKPSTRHAAHAAACAQHLDTDTPE